MDGRRTGEDGLIRLVDTGRKGTQGQQGHTALTPKAIFQSPEFLRKEVEATERQCLVYGHVVNLFMTRLFFFLNRQNSGLLMKFCHSDPHDIFRTVSLTEKSLFLF